MRTTLVIAFAFLATGAGTVLCVILVILATALLIFSQ